MLEFTHWMLVYIFGSCIRSVFFLGAASPSVPHGSQSMNLKHVQDEHHDVYTCCCQTTTKCHFLFFFSPSLVHGLLHPSREMLSRYRFGRETTFFFLLQQYRQQACLVVFFFYYALGYLDLEDQKPLSTMVDRNSGDRIPTFRRAGRRR